MEKINIAELLKDCPYGMELDCTMYQDVYFDYVDELNNELNIIHCYIQHGTHKTSITFNQHGTPNSDIKSKCVIFPKGKTTWEGFVPPVDFKDGDIIAVTMKPEGIWIGIFKQHKETSFESHCYLNTIGEFNSKGLKNHSFIGIRFATEEEKQELFDAIKENGYKWNSDTKTLKRLPKFKVGDRIRPKKDTHINISNILITKVNEYNYNGVIGYTTNPAHINFKYQDLYELVPDKFDISKLKPFDRVLVRTDNKHRWSIQFFERLNNVLKDSFVCMGGVRFHQCIPYEGNEHLLNTANDCDNFFKVWKE